MTSGPSTLRDSRLGRDNLARSQRDTRVLQCGPNRLSGSRAAESLKQARRRRRVQHRIDRRQIAQACRSHAAPWVPYLRIRWRQFDIPTPAGLT